MIMVRNSFEEMGNNLRRIRKTKGLTIAHLAKKCGCSPSLLSQIETGSLNPSLSILKSICDGLDISMAEIFSSDLVGRELAFSLMEMRERKTLVTEGGARFQLLSRGINIACEFILNEWPPGSSTGKEFYTHEGEECGVLLEGALDVETRDGVQHMKPGDSITLRSSIPHRILNPGKKKAIAYWVNSIPWVFTVK
jgi:transcriptional regulator with XRE-family HTH domain